MNAWSANSAALSFPKQNCLKFLPQRLHLRFGSLDDLLTPPEPDSLFLPPIPEFIPPHDERPERGNRLAAQLPQVEEARFNDHRLSDGEVELLGFGKLVPDRLNIVYDGPLGVTLRYRRVKAAK